MTLKTRNVISGVVIALLSVAAFLFVWKVMLFGPPGDYIVKAEFVDSGGVTKNSDVKIGGVPAGTVEEFELTENDTALVTMHLDSGAPIGAGARANSRPVNLLGEKYIELDTGDVSKPMQSGSTISVSRTSRPVELDDMLNVLQPDVRARMRIIINEAGIAMDGRGADFNDVLEQLPPAIDETEQVVRDFGRDNEVLERAIVQSDRVISAFNSESGDLQRLVDSAAGTLRITADKRREIAATLTEAPGTLRQLTSTLGDLGATATRLEPMSRQVRAAAPSLTDALERLPDFAKDAAPALSAASDAAPELTSLGRRATGPVERLAPTLDQLDTFAQRLQPVTDIADPAKDKGLRRILNVMDSWDKVIARTDGLGHTFGVQIAVDQKIITTALQAYLNDERVEKRSLRKTKPKAAPETAAPAPRGEEPPAAPRLPELKLPKLTLPAIPDLPLPPQVKKQLDGVGQGVDGTLDRLTGKDGSRRQGKGVTGKLLDYLIGP